MLLVYRLLTVVVACPIRVLLFLLASMNILHVYCCHSTHSSKKYTTALLHWRRARERCGMPSKGHSLTPKPLLWLHGVDVGETQIALTLAQEIWQKRPFLTILLTTNSLPAADLVIDMHDERLQHQFAPLDCIAWWRRFLQYWQPKLAIRCENEFWPNSINETAKHCPLLFIQARMSQKSFHRWQQASSLSINVNNGVANRVMSNITLALCQDINSSRYLKQLGVMRTKVIGNLKILPTPRSIDAKSEDYFARTLQHKNLWIAASTHKEEEKVIIEAHLRLLTFLPETICIIAPRNLSRVNHICRHIKILGDKSKIKVYQPLLQLRSHEPALIVAPFYILNSFGELASIYRYARSVFVGGTLIDKGGHNLFEPARHSCQILHGPHVRNTHADLLHKIRLTQIVRNSDDISRQLLVTLEKKFKREGRIQQIIENHSKIVRASMLQYLEPYLTRLDKNNNG